ncbi:MAG: AMP-binding protein [Dokdonella sp.]|uniref:AMP-binding protein n=1 Tax=Dokdonella sp. TaxID=2291710 RepID=UPI00326427C0
MQTERRIDDAAAWYASRPWTAHYPGFMLSELDVRADETMLSLLLDACDRYADRVAFELDGTLLTFREWHRQSDALARFFVHEWKLQAGDRILAMMPNLPAYPITVLGAWIAGLAIMPVYSQATTQEIEAPIAAILPKGIVGLDVLMDKFRAATGARDIRELVVSAPHALFGIAGPLPTHAFAFDAAITNGASLPPVERNIGPDDLALMAYTGGTTGVSKAVRITQFNMRIGVEMLRAALAATEAHANADGGLVISVHPFSHSAGMSVNLLNYASKGVTQLLFPKMTDTAAVVAGWRGRAVHSMLAGPAFYNHLTTTAGFAELDFSELHTGWVGGMALRADIRDRWESITGKPLYQGYGLTETSAPITAELGDERFIGSVGFPFPSVEVTIRDPDSDDLGAVPPGEIGEVWLRGPFIMSGYDQRPDETARTMTPDGWFRTGDLGRMNDKGALYLLGRIKDMILVDGANVYPASIENTVGQHPHVADVCAVAMPDDEDGERVRLFVVRRHAELDEAALIDWCVPRMSHYKIPKRVDFIDALPRSAVDKILRRELADWPLG